MKRLAILLAVGLAILAGWCAPPASADTAVIPQTDALPWSDPNHQTPLEQVASQIASEIAGRQVSVYCLSCCSCLFIAAFHDELSES